VRVLARQGSFVLKHSNRRPKGPSDFVDPEFAQVLGGGASDRLSSGRQIAADVCIGVVVATSRLIYPQAVGGDIGCGMLAVAFDSEATAIRDPGTAGRVLAELGRVVPLVDETVEPPSRRRQSWRRRR
jgi:hypothetical protein